MKKNHLLNYCHFYKGEESSPFKDQNKSMLWFYERSWVADSESATADFNPFDNNISDYIRIGLGDFQPSDGVPLTLKALLFNRYAKGSQSLADAVEPFKKFYLEHYRKGGK